MKTSSNISSAQAGAHCHHCCRCASASAARTPSRISDGKSISAKKSASAGLRSNFVRRREIEVQSGSFSHTPCRLTSPVLGKLARLRRNRKAHWRRGDAGGLLGGKAASPHKVPTTARRLITSSRQRRQTRGRLRDRSADLSCPGCSRSWRKAHAGFAPKRHSQTPTQQPRRR